MTVERRRLTNRTPSRSPFLLSQEGDVGFSSPGADYSLRRIKNCIKTLSVPVKRDIE
jgi:hypothetical protein